MDLVLVKQHLRILHNLEDALIQSYIDSAKAHVEQHCDIELVEGEPATDRQVKLSSDIQHAMLMLVDHWYNNRSAAVTGAVSSQVELGVERLLRYHKRF